MDDQKPNNTKPRDADLDRLMDAALAKYAAVEPRAGLESRILANLSAERSRVPDRSRWKCGLAAAVAAVFVIAIALVVRPGKTSKPTGADRQNVAIQGTREPERQFTSEQHMAVKHSATPVRRQRNRRSSSDIEVAARIPKLDQFPSPQPLSEQEQILASYVHNYPKDAALIAEARMEALRKDQEERQRELEADSSTNSRTQ